MRPSILVHAYNLYDGDNDAGDDNYDDALDERFFFD